MRVGSRCICEAGRISVPKGRYPQLAFIEESVLQCKPPEGGSFHPKLWVLRFLGDGPVRYRVLCLSRNLMFCRAWDTMLTLDGEVTARGSGDEVKGKDRLAEFLRALPQFTEQPSPQVIERADLIANEIQSTKFELPPDVTSARFWPLGTSPRRLKPFQDIGKRLLIVSPFVNVTGLASLTAGTSTCDLVATLPQLGALAHRPEGISRFFVLNERAVAEADDSTAMSEALSEPMADAIAQGDLHAKLYVTELGTEAHVWTGSANATSAAFDKSVEFLVEFTGHRKRFGIDVLMTPEKGEVRLINLVKDVSNTGVVAETVLDPDVETLERLLEGVRCALRDASLQAVATEASKDIYNLSIFCRGENRLEIPSDISARCWPVGTDALHGEVRSCQRDESLVEFPPVSTKALTTFFAFELSGSVAQKECRLALYSTCHSLEGPPIAKSACCVRSWRTVGFSSSS